MKRLNVRQQEHLNNKFREACRLLIEAKEIEVSKLALKLPSITIHTTAVCRYDRNVLTGPDIGKDFEVALSKAPQLAKFAYKHFREKEAELKAIYEECSQLREVFKERVLFSSDDLEGVATIVDEFNAAFTKMKGKK